MRPTARSLASLAMFCLLNVAALATHTAAAQSSVSSQLPEGVYLNLTQDFYQALRQESANVYSTNADQGQLKELAISARFMVQTNLAILKQQEQMVYLLQQLLRKP